MFADTASTVVSAWNAFNSFLPFGTMLGIVFASGLVAFAVRKGLGLFRWGIGR